MLASLYYVAIDPETRIIRTWYQLNTPPTAPNFYPITKDQFDSLSTMPGAKLTSDGTLEEYTPPPPPLKTRAEATLQQARTTIYNNYGILNEPTPDAWVSYLKSLMAIVSGADTTSTTLPTAPSDPTT